MSDSVPSHAPRRGTWFRRGAAVVGAAAVGAFVAVVSFASESSDCGSSVLTVDDTSSTSAARDVTGTYVTPSSATVTAADCGANTGSNDTWVFAVWDGDSDDYGDSAHVCCFEYNSAGGEMPYANGAAVTGGTSNTALAGSYKWGTSQTELSTNSIASPLLTDNGADCDDATATTFPGSAPNESFPALCYADADGDDYGDSTASGTVQPGTDCDDSSAVTYPGIANLESNSSACMTDADSDGFGDDTVTGTVVAGTDCDDSAVTINTSATEVCDSVDNDCDGSVDEGVGTTYYADTDSDGFGDASSTVTSCSTAPTGYVANSSDCDDTSNKTYRGAAFNESASACMNDDDGDGYGDDTPATGVTAGSDCDDTTASAFPGATETCDTVDNDCDGSVDEGVTTTYYADTDSDGQGDSGTSLNACTQPTGYVANANDCDDTSNKTFRGAANNESATACMNDDDGDGYGDVTVTGTVVAGTDCDDSVAAINPNATEVCDSVDNDCDSSIDEGVTSTFYADTDSDGQGDSSSTTTDCAAPTGYVSNAQDCDDSDPNTFRGSASAESASACMTDADGDGYGDDNPGTGVTAGSDCDDTNASANPGETEVCDSVDNDCDSTVDEGVTTIWYQDADSDGQGSTSVSTTACSQPTGYVLSSGDCDDSDPNTFRGAANNDSATACMTDGDGDGYGDTTAPTGGSAGTDCDDTDSAIFPGATEVCDSVDNDCDGTADEGVRFTYYFDADSDGYGLTGTTTSDCATPSGYADASGDCDDTDPNTFPGSAERQSTTACMTDDDNDGYGDSSPGTGVTAGTDCDDAAATTFPGSAQLDSTSACMADADNDGYGDTTAPTGGTAGNDCDDTDSAISPAASEVCDFVDNDCDGTVDDGVSTTYYLDGDSDGYGLASTTQVDCTQPSGYAEASGDCDDADPNTFPGSAERQSATICMTDDDNDGYGDSSPGTGVTAGSDCDDATATTFPGSAQLDSTSACMADADNDGYGDTTAPTGGTAGNDCDDTDSAISPAASEVCDFVDNDCDGTVDDGVSTTYYLDGDSDGYGLASTTQVDCTQPSGYAEASGDCDDADPNTFPGSAERQSTTICMTDDDNDGYGDISPGTGVTAGTDCDDAVATTFPGTAQFDSSSACMADADNDGYGDTTAPSNGTAGTDCDDALSTTNPGASETCDSVDNDCDGTVDDGVLITWYADTDSDGFGDSGVSQQSCTQPTGYVRSQTDCDDSDPNTYPGAASNDSGTACMTDDDGDGYGDANPASTVTAGTDCNDADNTIFPGATEACDGIDNDCNNIIDDGAVTGWFADNDNDGFGDLASRVTACAQPSGYVGNSTDCDDNDGDTFPGAAPNDSATDCMTDGDADDWGDDTPSSGTAIAGTDCNDSDAGISPSDQEVCDASDVDEDCDGLSDDNDSSATGQTNWYIDSDNDSYGDSGATAVPLCEQPSGYVANNTDCDDATATANPGATEACDGIDNDCDGSTDEGLTNNTWYVDIDEDGYGAASSGATLAQCTDPTATGACSDGDTGTVCYRTNDLDCDDSDDSINPAGQEVCDAVDNDCDGLIDDDDSGVDNSVATGGGNEFLPDSDSDGYPNPNGTAIERCNAPSGYALVQSVADSDVNNDGYVDYDCNDSNSAINPAEIEICDTGSTNYSYTTYDATGTAVVLTVVSADGTDENCDGTVDDGDPAIDQGTWASWYKDDDEDTYGTSATGAGTVVFACDDPTATSGCSDGSTSTACYSTDNSDCDDTDSAINPNATEVCDSIDNDCDGLTDANDDNLSGGTTFYRDADSDGYGDAGDSSTECATSRSGYVLNATDCDDSDINTYPSASEVCDGARNDCNRISSGIPTDEIDLDNDGYVECGFDGTVTWQGSGTINVGEDCEPTDPTSYPSATEVCDGVYNDCDGRGGTSSAPDNETDNDGDGYVECYDGTTTWDVASTQPSVGVDCDDTDSTVYPTASEVCDGQFNDCDDTLYGTQAAPDDELDTDGDLYVECNDGEYQLYWVGDSTVLGGDDCNGADALVFPGATEQCDGRFNDCSDPLIASQSAPDSELDVDGDRWVECNYNSGTWQGLSSIQGGNDCDDNDDSVYPGATEVCDGQFNDCDDAAYDASSQPDDEFDDDGDYFIECVRYSSIAWNPADASLSSADPLNKCPLSNPNCYDCDDTDAATHPPYRVGFGLTPNAYFEDGDLAYDCLTDADGDGYGAETVADGVTAGTDCDDTLDDVFPNSPEVCEADIQVDNDCDGSPNTYQGEPVDETADGAITAYVDDDGDGYGTGSAYIVCELASGFSSSGSDCDDLNNTIYPGAAEVCNEIDDDCDDEADEAEDLDPTTSGCVDMYRDIDEDGYGDYDTSLCLCLAGDDTEGTTYRDDRYVTIGGDCDDFDSDTKPLTCDDGIDNDGDGTTDAADPDCVSGLTEDGSAVETKVEYIDGNDNDCDGMIPVIELDCDDDGSLPMLPIQVSSLETADEVGLADCTGDGATRYIECWADDEVQVVCDLTDDGTGNETGSGLWMLRLDGSDDNWGSRYSGGRRIYTTRTCTSIGDCDDQCASRCPDMEESCDGLDNDCSAANIEVEDATGDGIPASMVSTELVSGTISIDELDLDLDGYLACDTFSDQEIQVHATTATCDEIVDAETFGFDCNNLCSLSNPDAVERCNGFLDVCLGDAEGTDLDFDDLRTCGAFSAPLSDELQEDVVVLAWVRDSGGADTGATGGTTDTAPPTSDSGDTAATADSGDTGSTSAVSAGTGDLVPLLLPRSFTYTGAKPNDWPFDRSVGEFITNDETGVTSSISCIEAGSTSTNIMELYACDQPLYDELVALYGAMTVHQAMCDSDATELVSACFDGSGSCGIVNVEYLSTSDETLWDGYENDCDSTDPDLAPQLISRSLWTKDRILASRELVVEYECHRLFGLPCASVTSDVSVSTDWATMVDTTDALQRAQWKELDRFNATAVTAGTVAYCWGDPTGGLDDIGKEVGGDCSDVDILSHRDSAEGPGDLLGQLDAAGPADCSTCLDGLDNNCNGYIDCEDPACAVCFVGQGSGCSGGSTCGGGGCAVASAYNLQGRRAGFVALLWLLTIVTRRRKRA